MTSTTERLDLTIDILGLKGQRALVLPHLKPADLTAAVLREFVELEYLREAPDAYDLVFAGTRKRLNPAEPVGKQVSEGRHLALVERELEKLPQGAARPRAALYLRELSKGVVFPVAWVPAVIGRRDSRAPNEPLAADLLDQRVSRRHALIYEEDGGYLVECVNHANNPLSVRGRDGVVQAVEQERRRIEDGDVLLFEYSGLALKFLVRAREAAQ